MEQEKRKKKINIAVIVIAILLVVLITVGVLILIKMNKGETKETSSNVADNVNDKNSEKTDVPKNENNLISFANLKADDEKYTNIQQKIVDYFDDNYFTFGAQQLQEYPQIFQGAKVTTNMVIMKVLKSDDTEFEVVGIEGGSLAADASSGETSVYDAGYGEQNIEEVPENGLIILKGKQLNKRLKKGDVITLFGRYKGTDSFTIDGKDYILPVVNSINLIQFSNDNKDANYRFNLDTIKDVAEYIFGKDIKISTPVLGEDFDYEVNYSFNPFYKITLDNQSNANFNVFNMYRNSGAITYNKTSSNTIKRLFITPDFQHYIVTTYDKTIKHVYIDYFDKDFKKIWNREFDFESKEESIGPIDCTNERISIVIDNDLYLIDSSTGKDVIDPILVGQKIRVNIMPDGIILIGKDNKDTIMKVNYDGKIIFRTNGNINFDTVDFAGTQIINDKMVIYLLGTGGEYGLPYEKYLVLNNDGTISNETESTIGAF